MSIPRPINWYSRICSICSREYPWPVGLPPSKLDTCGSYECVRTAVDRDIYHIPGLVPLPPWPGA